MEGHFRELSPDQSGRGAEGPAGDLSFLDAKKEVNKLSRISARNSQEDSRLAEAQRRMDSLVSEVEESGALEDVKDDLGAFNQRLGLLEGMKGSGELKEEHIIAMLGDVQRAAQSANQLTQTDEEGNHKGVREYFYTRGLREIREKAAKISPKEVPDSAEEQRKLVRTLLNRIEQNDLETYSVQNSISITPRIEAILPNLRPEIRREVEVRLKLQDCYVGVKSALIAGGDSQGPEGKITGGLFREKQSELNSKGRLLEAADFHTLLVEGLPDLKIAEAFGYLENAAFKGEKIGEKNDGSPIIKKIFEKNTTRYDENKVYEQIILKLGGGENARKSLQLAQRVAWATLEVSVWNNDIVGNDPLAESIYLMGFREARGQRGAQRGPTKTVGLIQGFGSSYFRLAKLPDQTPLYNPGNLSIKKEDREKKEKVDIRESVGEKEKVELSVAEKKYLMRIRGLLNDDAPIQSIDVKNLNFLGLGPGDYGVYLSARIPQILQVKEWLLETDWQPKDMQRDQAEKFLAPFRFVDSDDILELRYKFILGAFDSASAEFRRMVLLDWTYANSLTVIRALTRELGKKDDGTSIFFFSKEEMNRVLKETNFLGLRKAQGVTLAKGATGSR